MHRFPKRGAAILILTVVVSSRVTFSETPAKVVGSRLSTQDLRQAEIIGDIGVPLGTLANVKGRNKDMTFTRRKADDGRIVLVISSVNGEALPKAVEFDFIQDYLFERIRPEDGQDFELIGFESGHFEGDVEGQDK